MNDTMTGPWQRQGRRPAASRRRGVGWSWSSSAGGPHTHQRQLCWMALLVLVVGAVVVAIQTEAFVLPTTARGPASSTQTLARTGRGRMAPLAATTAGKRGAGQQQQQWPPQRRQQGTSSSPAPTSTPKQRQQEQQQDQQLPPPSYPVPEVLAPAGGRGKLTEVGWCLIPHTTFDSKD